MKKTRGKLHFLFFGKFLHHWKQKWWNMIKKNEKNEKNQGKLHFFIFWKILIFPEFFFIFFYFFHFFIIFHHFLSVFINSTTGSKHDKNMIKTWKKTRGKLHFFIFRKIFAPLEAKMMKNDKNNDKKMKKRKKWKKLRENWFLSFLILFAPLEEKNDKKMKKWKTHENKMVKTWLKKWKIKR